MKMFTQRLILLTVGWPVLIVVAIWGTIVFFVRSKTLPTFNDLLLAPSVVREGLVYAWNTPISKIKQCHQIGEEWMVEQQTTLKGKS